MRRSIRTHNDFLIGPGSVPINEEPYLHLLCFFIQWHPMAPSIMTSGNDLPFDSCVVIDSYSSVLWFNHIKPQRPLVIENPNVESILILPGNPRLTLVQARHLSLKVPFDVTSQFSPNVVIQPRHNLLTQYSETRYHRFQGSWQSYLSMPLSFITQFPSLVSRSTFIPARVFSPPDRSFIPPTPFTVRTTCRCAKDSSQ